MGDPQAPFDRVLEVLDANRALGADGRLAPGVLLVSIGDHFDYDLDDPVAAGREGVAVLRWMAGHDPAQVRLLLGNHDTARVMELIGLDDRRFAEARALGRAVREADGASGEEEFARLFPDVPTPGLAARDYASFSEQQRDLVIELLLAGRFDLALAGRLRDGRDVLITHAGVTLREAGLLGVEHVDARRIAAALQERLRDAVDARRADWAAGRRTPLSLEPLHVAGKSGAEGGGLLYHRPARSDRPEADRAWELDPERPRRFDPRWLPAGLHQVVGHTGHRKCKSELGDAWLTDAARQRAVGGIRTLRVRGGEVSYDLGVAPAESGATDMILIDGEMSRVPA
ncbi:MAG TPA: hypothetical protein VNO33_09660, partial [Kofleriaceae bacterium]|nr:hypothetical protein [Kofleriaceae bacterium]